MSDKAGQEVARIGPVAERDETRKAVVVGPGNRLLNMTLNDMASLAKLFARSGLLGKYQTAEAAFAVIVAGQELGLTPMLALRCISLVDGKVTVAADSQLGAFKRSGGRATFTTLTATSAVLCLRHANGDEHVESFTIEDAARAGLLNKDNWKKHPKAMLRSRVITAGLKSVGFEPVAGMYDPEELEPVPSEPYRPSAEMVAASLDNHTAAEGIAAMGEAAAAGDAAQQASGVLYPFGKYKNTRVDQRNADGTHTISDVHLQEGADWLRKKRDGFKPGSEDEARFAQWLDGVELEQDNRRIEAERLAMEEEAEPGPGDDDPPDVPVGYGG